MSVPCKDGVKVQAGRLHFLQTQSYWLKKIFFMGDCCWFVLNAQGKLGEEKSLLVGRVQHVQNVLICSEITLLDTGFTA